MTTPLRQLLAQYRATAKTERGKGNYFERVITISLETMKIVRSLPKLEIA